MNFTAKSQVCMYTDIETTGVSNSLQNIWSTLPEWFPDYHTYGRVPGVSIDGKHVANLIGLPLVSLTGRDNARHVLVFGVTFLRLEGEILVTWFLEQFPSAAKHSPKVVFTDASVSMIASVRKV